MIRYYLKCRKKNIDRQQFDMVLRYAIENFFREKISAEVSVDLSIIEDVEMIELNRRFKAKECTTDVLAFYDGEPEPDEGFYHLGDVAVSVDAAAREADLLGVDIQEELLLYAVHGVLHLLGFRDGNDAEKKQMRSAEKNVLNKFDIYPVWDE